MKLSHLALALLAGAALCSASDEAASQALAEVNQHADDALVELAQHEEEEETEDESFLQIAEEILEDEEQEGEEQEEEEAQVEEEEEEEEEETEEEAFAEIDSDKPKPKKPASNQSTGNKSTQAKTAKNTDKKKEKSKSTGNCRVDIPKFFAGSIQEVTNTPEGQQALKAAVAAPGSGGIYCGKAYKVTKGGVYVYRAWQMDDKKVGYNKFGGWWAFVPPHFDEGRYRHAGAICKNWTPQFTHVSKCTLKVGSVFAVGPGQSAKCTVGPSYGTNPFNQIKIPNNTKANPWVVHVENCKDFAWGDKGRPGTK